ncbi:MAG: maltose alpha-D-glucosyltransferase / alpha-amylase [Chloroflexota bacterium]|jgi:maltose alpha-D-glucosyltransferase/alpha-amylase|nr:maltose alpha-D-glucosyltransferase / alpha-amylase [Chloroflexota bacterium]
MKQAPRPATTARPAEPTWYRHGVFYELLVRGFADGNGDGVGDIRGLTSRLDYLKWLGIDCIWMLPINTSPMRDGGYDISDYFSVQPEYGDIDAVRGLVRQAHRRNIRVIVDLVMNHTSDAHPWFQEARSSPDNPKRDWYVWSDNPTRYSDARIIFIDTESSNWTWDEQAGAFYFHRFFSHQPDLNYDNPEVREMMMNVVRFWLDVGLDGFRLDAVPYLYERDGTNCENLPETHAFLAELRETVDREYGGERILLAEANQWPEDVVDYFGTEERPECHLCFHFPLMPRMFMALRREQRYPITEILERTPPIPSGGQWGLFLRNHDELTLEMVTDDERDYMYSEYARDPRMKLNLGIRRRLAPLLNNGRRQMELFYGLLLSLPGTPILYYGDELGMGDNVYLGDRDGVRTPMHWTADRNAGFSRADFAQLYLPPLMDPVYGFASVNVESQQRNESSLLHWLRRFLAVRRRHPVFGEGDFEALDASNPSVFAFLRRGEDETILCVNNLSRFAQPVELDLRRFSGWTPVELVGKVHFPRIGDLPYLLTMGSHGFYWFLLEAPR